MPGILSSEKWNPFKTIICNWFLIKFSKEEEKKTKTTFVINFIGKTVEQQHALICGIH